MISNTERICLASYDKESFVFSILTTYFSKDGEEQWVDVHKLGDTFHFTMNVGLPFHSAVVRMDLASILTWATVLGSAFHMEVVDALVNRGHFKWIN